MVHFQYNHEQDTLNPWKFATFPKMFNATLAQFSEVGRDASFLFSFQGIQNSQSFIAEEEIYADIRFECEPHPSVSRHLS